MARQDELNRGLLEDILSEIAPDIIGGIIVPKEGYNLLDLIEMPEIEASSAKHDDIMKLAQFVASNLIYEVKSNVPATKDGFVGTTIGGLINTPNLDLEMYKNAFMGMVKAPANYFDIGFEPKKLSEEKKKEFMKLLTPVYGKDQLEAAADQPFRFKEGVLNNPGKYLLFKSEGIAEIYKGHKKNIDMILKDYAAAVSGENLPEVVVMADDPTDKDANSIIPSHVMDPAGQDERDKAKSWWEKRFDNFYLKTFRAARWIDRRRADKGKPALSSVLIQDYGPAIKEGGLVYVLTSGKKWDELRKEYGDQRIADYGRALFNSSVKHPGMFASLIGGFLAFDMINNIPILLIGMGLGATSAIVGTCAAHEAGYKVPGIDLPPTPPQIREIIKEVPTPPEYTQAGCEGNCKEYFICLPAPECVPKTRIEFRDRTCPSVPTPPAPEGTPCPCTGRVRELR